MRRSDNEKDFSATQHSQKAESWLSRENVNKGRPSCHQEKTQERQKKTYTLKPDLTLGRDERIKSQRVFNRVLRSGKWVASRYFAIYFEEAPVRAVGFTVSRKVRSKPKRNRIKRRLRELYRTNKNLLPQSGFFIFMGLPPALTADYRVLEKTLKVLSRKLTQSLQKGQSTS